jgi:hypothetical protein
MFDRVLPCPHCRYDLRGITGAICPECGNNVEAHLRIADLSPARIRQERFERLLHALGKGFRLLVLLSPLVAAAILLSLQ